MAGQATISAVGSVTIATTGAQSGNALTQLNNLINNAGSNVYTSDPSSTATAISAPTPGAPGAVYGVNDGFNGSLDLPSGYAAVVLSANTQVTVAAADSATAIASAGQLDYTGASTALTSFGDNSVLDDSGDLATVAVGGANVQVTLGGAGQALNIDPGTQGKFTETGNGAHIMFAGADTSASGSTTNSAPSTPGGISVFQLTADTSLGLDDSSAASVVVLHSGADTVSATAGASTVYATTGNDVYFGGAAQTYFVGATGTTVATSTIFGGSGNDTVFAQAGVKYTAGGGNNEFIGGRVADIGGGAAAHSTVTATTGHDMLFGGTVGDQYNLGDGSETFVAGGGADTLLGGSVAPTIFGGANENLKLLGTNAGTIVADGDMDVINASQANQGSTFFVSNLPSVLNTTLIGSTGAATLSGAHDSFVVGNAGTSSTAGTAHTISIENFHTGDAFFLSGYSAADGAAFEAAVTKPTPAGNVSFTLSDNTTVTFVGSHPTATFNGGTVGL